MKMRVQLPMILFTALVIASCSKSNLEERNMNPLREFNTETAKQKRKSADENLIHAAYSSFRMHQSQTNSANGNRSGVIRVPDDYSSIQAAIDAAADGAQIMVKAGTYSESIFVNKKGLTLSAAKNAVVKGGMLVSSSDVTIRDFSFDCTGIEPPLPGQVQFMGIVVINNASDVLISGNKILNSYFGIVLDQGITRTRIFRNQITSNNQTMYGGIRLNGAENNSIEQNTITGSNDAAISLLYNFDPVPASSNNRISGNTMRNNGVGIYVDGGGGFNIANQITENTATECSIGIYMDFANNNLIQGNTTSDNSLAGILLFENTSGNTVRENSSLNNGICDIVNFGVGNIFTANSTGCTEGL